MQHPCSSSKHLKALTDQLSESACLNSEDILNGGTEQPSSHSPLQPKETTENLTQYL